jgi:sterol desaturase/sphingolipid hydroxylase (fatty acid hydroxylase superfamily)
MIMIVGNELGYIVLILALIIIGVGAFVVTNRFEYSFLDPRQLVDMAFSLASLVAAIVILALAIGALGWWISLATTLVASLVAWSLIPRLPLSRRVVLQINIAVVGLTLCLFVSDMLPA